MGEDDRSGAPPPAASRPLDGITVIVTRAEGQARALAEPLEALGARVIASPAIRFEDPADWGPADRALRAGASFDTLIFTSANAVEAVGRRLAHLGLAWDRIAGPKIASMGPGTERALRAHGVTVHVVPATHQAEGMIEALGADDLSGRRFLLPRAEKAREILPGELRRRGATVEVVTVYRTVGCPPAAEAVAALERRVPAIVVFTSDSTVEHFIGGLGESARDGLRASAIAAIGPITAAAVRAAGLDPSIVPSSSSAEALVEAIRNRFPGPGSLQPSRRAPV